MQRTIVFLCFASIALAQTPGAGRVVRITPEEQQKLEAAIPTKAPAVPKKPRKLLVFDLNVGRSGHPSIPYANVAMELMGKKTGAWEATISRDPAIFGRIQEFDAVYLNNTIGDIFGSDQAREAFAKFVSDGGGLVGNHAATVTAPDWTEFGVILGGRGASHRMTDEKVIISVDDSSSPIVKAFGSTPFEYTDEIFRFQPPYSRDKVRVLLSVDSAKTDMNQGRCFGQCYRDDNDYPVAWIQRYGKGRVFYTGLGHNAHVFWDPKALEMFLAGIQYALGDLDAEDRPLQRISNLDTILADVSRYQWGQDQAPVRSLERAMGMLGPSPAAVADAEKKLIAALQGPSTIAAKEAICRHLATVGSSKAVPALAALLPGKQTAEMARYALERIDSPDAGAALRNALSTTDPRIKAGLIQSIGRRNDTAAVAALAKLLDDRESTISAAATNALGMIGSPDAERALLSKPMSPKIADALFTVAEDASAERASAIYAKLVDRSMPEETRAAAIHGIARKSGPAATSQLVEALQDRSVAVQMAAVAELTSLAPAELISATGKLTGPVKIQAMLALAARQERAALPMLIEATGNPDPGVRIAALEGIAAIGTKNEIPMLVKKATDASGEEQTAAHFALTRIAGSEGDAAITAAIPAATGKEKLELIRVTGERGIKSAADALLLSASSADATVRLESLRALRGIAGPEKTPALLEILLHSSDQDRKEVERALASTIGRGSPPNLQPVVVAFENAQSAKVRASLASVLAMTNQSSALPTLKKALESNEADVQRAAINGLSEWPSAEPMDDLLRVAKGSSNGSLQVLALRGYIRLLQRPTGRTPEQNAKLLGAAMDAATRPEEKKAILAALQRAVAPESLTIAQNAAKDPAVAEEAKLAITTLEQALAARRK